ncbi:MAG: hypothetical protein COA94_00825 [Rickettsiales bacterium]|nr:MAG: hypothetical protein COA94_00825 [Rickettsiales bacterium]
MKLLSGNALYGIQKTSLEKDISKVISNVKISAAEIADSASEQALKIKSGVKSSTYNNNYKGRQNSSGSKLSGFVGSYGNKPFSVLNRNFAELNQTIKTDYETGIRQIMASLGVEDSASKLAINSAILTLETALNKGAIAAFAIAAPAPSTDQEFALKTSITNSALLAVSDSDENEGGNTGHGSWSGEEDAPEENKDDKPTDDSNDDELNILV